MSESMPTTMTELWNQGWVANNDDQAGHQAFRMFDLFRDTEVEVDRLEFQWGGDHAWCEEVMLSEPYPKLVPYECEPREWDGEVLYAMWSLYVKTPGQIILFEDQVRRNGEWVKVTKRRSLDYLANRNWAYPIRTTAPGIGTAEGFGHKDGLVLPEPCEIVEGDPKTAGHLGMPNLYCCTHMTYHGQPY